MADVVSIVTSVALGGLGATWLQRRWSVETQRRIRRDVEREGALEALVAACTGLELQVDFMLSPNCLVNGVFQTNSMLAADGHVRQVETAWRLQAAPYLPGSDRLAEAVVSTLHHAQEMLNGTNPPVPEFLPALKELRGAGASLRAAAQEEIMRPADRRSVRRWVDRRRPRQPSQGARSVPG